VSSGLVADANDDSVADHRLHDGAELTRSCQSADFSEKRLERLRAFPDSYPRYPTQSRSIRTVRENVANRLLHIGPP